MNALSKIRTRAKQLQRDFPNKAWTDLISMASKEYRSGKLGKVKDRQTGTSNKKADRERSAKTPGKRTVKHGKKKATIYYERRKNRSDKPGQLTGVSVASLASALKKKMNEKLDKLVVQKFHATKKAAKRKLQKAITAQKSKIRKLL